MTTVRLFSGCLGHGVCRGVCRNTDCPNYDMVVAARLVVEKQVEGIVYSDKETRS